MSRRAVSRLEDGVAEGLPAQCYRVANEFVDSDHPEVVAFARAACAGAVGERAQAVALFYAVRDGFRYSPWQVYFDAAQYKASLVLARRDQGAHCIDKALLLAACARAMGIPARLHFATVRNHVGTGALEEKLGTDLLVYHGYTGLWLAGRWVAATPAFNRHLCEKLGVAPLEWDGVSDAIFQAYDRRAGAFMEYVADHGHSHTVPVDDMVRAWTRHYRLDAVGWPAAPS